MALPIYGLGRNEKVYVVPETTYGTAAAAPAAGNAVKFRDCSITQNVERVYREDKRTTRSWLQTIQRRKTVNWTLSGYLLPSGAAGTAPDGWDDVFKAAFGSQTVNASTSVVYSLVKEFEQALTIHRAVGTSAATAVYAEMATGCVVNELNFNLSSQNEAMVTASGMGVEVFRAGKSAVVTDSGTSVVVTAGDGHKFDANIYVDIGAVTAKAISSVTPGSDTFVVGAHAAASAADVVCPTACAVSQTFTSTALPISGVLGSCSLEGGALDIVSANISLNNGIQVHNDKYGTDVADGFHLGNRSVSGSIVIRLTDTTFKTIAKARRNSTVALSLVSGTAAGSIATFSLPAVLLDYTAIPSNASEDIMVTLPFKAYGSTGEDEITLTLT